MSDRQHSTSPYALSRRTGVTADAAGITDFTARTGDTGAPSGPPAYPVPGIFALAPSPAPLRSADTPVATSPGPAHDTSRDPAHDPARVTAAGAEWLASASSLPESVHALWRHRPASPSVLPCGTAFDVVSAAPLLGRRLLDRLWSSGPGSGPVAVHRGRLLLFAAPGTAQRLPALMCWGEWGELFRTREGGPGRQAGRQEGHETTDAFPPLLCHGPGDLVTIPAPQPYSQHGQHGQHGQHEQHSSQAPGPTPRDHASPSPADRSHWLVAPGTRHPWLPGPDVLLWSCVQARRTRVPDRADPPPAEPPTGFRAGRGPGEGRGINFRNRGS